jgi:hypothetical protein
VLGGSVRMVVTEVGGHTTSDLRSGKKRADLGSGIGSLQASRIAVVMRLDNLQRDHGVHEVVRLHNAFD